MKLSKFFYGIFFLQCYTFTNDIIETNPLDLVCSERFDVMAKYLYGRHRELGVIDGWAQEVYREHLRVWSNFKEYLPLPSFPHYDCAKQYIKKDNFQDFLSHFNQYLDSFKNTGFDKSKSVLPIDKNGIIIDGAHRLASALVYSAPVIGKLFNFNTAAYDSNFFKNQKRFVKEGLTQKYLDSMALEYVSLKNNTYIAILFPSAPGKFTEVKNILNQYGKIVYEKEVILINNGAFNVLYLCYEGEKWVGNQSNDFTGIRSALKNWFPQGQGKVTVFLFECENFDNTKNAKQKIRNLFKIGNNVIHINDTYQETKKLAQALFNENSIHWLNKAKLKFFTKFESLFKKYKLWISSNNINDELLCVDSGAVLAAYGLRDCNDLDFLSYPQILHTNDAYINNHEDELHYHQYGKQDIIFSPQNYFYYGGLKFASLQVVKAMKTKRNEPKDQQDIRLINAII